MNIYRLGKHNPSLPELTSSIPPFEVDGVLVVDEKGLEKEALELVAYYRRHGRPIVASLAEIEGLARTNYAPINCSFYDNFEAAIVQLRIVNLEYRQTDGSVKHEAIRLRDLKTHLSEEYVQLDRGEWLRLDRIVSVDGAGPPSGPDAEQEAGYRRAGASCRF